MELTVKQWSTLYGLVREAREHAQETYAEMKAEATPEGSSWPDEDKLNENPGYKVLKDLLFTLGNIQVELENQKI